MIHTARRSRNQEADPQMTQIFTDSAGGEVNLLNICVTLCNLWKCPLW